MRNHAWIVAAALVAAAPSLAADGVDPNTASKAELESLPGIGAKIADAIIRDREENGPFGSVDELTRVPGVTPSLLAKVRGGLAIDGGGGGGGPAPIVVQEGKVVGGDVVHRVLQRFAGEPSIREVQQATIEHLRVHPDRIDAWLLRARTHALLPELQIDADVDRDDDEREVTDLEGGDAPTRTTNLGTGVGAGVRAKWELDRLVFEPFEATLMRESVRIGQVRDRAIDEVTRRYFERRRLQVDLELSPPTELADRVRKELRLQELTADIDAATGGWFVDKLKAAGRSPY